MPEVSVLMNCRNGEPFLAAALSSVLSQSWRDLEIIFWDNQSTDRSAEIARGFGPAVRYFRSATPMTLGEARNAALSRAAGRYVAVLDADDRWLPGKLEAQVGRMESRPQAGLVYCDSRRVTGLGAAISRWSEERQFRRGWVLEALLASCFISMSTVLTRRSVLDEVGGFDPAYTQVEEWDLYLRIAERYEIDYLDAVLVEETVHAGNASRDYDAVAAETCALLERWGERCPRQASLCRQQMAAARFRQAGVGSYRAWRAGHIGAALRHTMRCMALALRHPIAVPRGMQQFLNAPNQRMFVARFS